MVFHLLALLLLPCALAAPKDEPHVDAIHIPILRRSVSPQERVAALPHVMDNIRLKYGFKPVNQKRSTTSSLLTDEGNDSTYSALVSIGSPAQDFNLILDTGSSDLWVATTQCSSCPAGTPFFDPSKSTSFTNDSAGVQINYGSGSVNGYVAQDTVTFAGFSISNQKFLAVTDISVSMLNDSLSGIMGLGFQPLSSLQTTPFWQTVYNQSKLSSPVFSFYIERYVNDPEQVNAAPGGIFTLGGTNTSLYQGEIDFIGMPNGTVPSFWLQQVQTIKIQNKTISVPSSQGLAAIDTGTSLIAAPSSIAQEIWAAVPNSVPLNGQYAGLYAFPCSTSVTVSISFGGVAWAINTEDMNLGAVGESSAGLMCAGGIFDVGSTAGGGQGAPGWIVGDTFLKNVYSVFQAEPPAVGFAQLASNLASSDGTTGQGTSSGTAGIPVASGLGSNGASSRATLSTLFCLVVSLTTGLFIAFK